MSNLYPIEYNGKIYHKQDCDDVFVAFYTCVEALSGLGGVYVSGGLWVYPDGEMGEL